MLSNIMGHLPNTQRYLGQWGIHLNHLVVAHVIIVSPKSQLDLDFDFGLLWFLVWV